MLDAMMAAIFVFLGAVAVCFITVAAVGFIRMGSASDGMCAPSRRANITASKPQPQRRVLVQLGPPAGWREPPLLRRQWHTPRRRLSRLPPPCVRRHGMTH